MKKLFMLMFAVLLGLSMTACADNPSSNNKGGTMQGANTATKDTVANATEPTTEPTGDITEWGQEDLISTNDGETIDRYIIHVPYRTGTYYMRGKISEQPDETVVLLSGQYVKSPKVEEVSEIFNAYLESTENSLEALYGVLSKNFEISVDSSMAVTIGDYDMYVHEGIITYDFDGNQRTHQYVAYATKLKPSGNCAYWMVYDISENQSNGKLIAEHALNMAKTLREHEE